MSKFRLSLLIHAHQPVGNFDSVLEQAYERAYLPFLELLDAHPQVRLGLHYSGSLLEWVERRHPEFFERLRSLLQRGQIELVGGGFYEPILIAIPHADRAAQLRRMADYLEKHFGVRPRGAWLAERVWEPQLAATLAAGGVEYSLVDDAHFLAAGFTPQQLFGVYVAEDLGATVRLLPGLKRLRYLIPFGLVEDCVAFLRDSAREHPGGFAVMGDDNEKFGVWPETWKHCYENHWLEDFFEALEKESEWLEMATPAECALDTPLGRADLPAASYSEMMEWALPTPVRQHFHAVQQELAARPEVAVFLRGGIWRNFFSKYAEANLLHKKMLHVSGKRAALEARTRRGLHHLRPALADAESLLLRAQCNDAYWHGIFGGIYAPHLRTENWRALIRAETILDAAEQGRPRYADLGRLDFDADGAEELYVVTETFAALWKPGDGATLAALDFRPSSAALINSIMRRPEPYHVRLREAAAAGAPAPAAVSIHNQFKVKEPGLERRLRYDAWPRHAFRLLLFSPQKTFADFEALRLDAAPSFAGHAYRVISATPDRAEFALEAPLLPAGAAAPAVASPAPAAASAEAKPALLLAASKAVNSVRAESALEMSCRLTLASRSAQRIEVQAGLEMALNLLAPAEPDRFIEAGGARHPLSWAGEIPGGKLRMVDKWQKFEVELEAPAAAAIWVAPIETVSESEEGFERVYQGSQILPVWPVELEPGEEWTASLLLRVSRG